MGMAIRIQKSLFMNINIVAVGKIREKYIKSGIEEFLKRIQPYSCVKIIEIEAETVRSDDQIKKAMLIEGEKILNILSDNAYIIAMDISGKKLNSEKFASKIQDINTQGINQLAFVIGGAFGLDEKVKRRANFSLSLSEMTLPHQLARLFLLEQIYRAFKIINNEPYHK
jgi:23S rRNA (pseudouridine1915-N3)-methyltransferase